MAFQVGNTWCSFRMASCVCPAHFSLVYISFYLYIFLSFFKLFHLPESIIQKVDHLNANAFVRLSSVERKHNKIAMICIHTSKGVLYKVCTGRLLPKVEPLFLLWPHCQHRYLFHIPLLEKKVPLFFVCFFFKKSSRYVITITNFPTIWKIPHLVNWNPYHFINLK